VDIIIGIPDLVQVKYEMVRRVRVEGEQVARGRCVWVLAPVVLCHAGGAG
jgi:hypothetical protein